MAKYLLTAAFAASALAAPLIEERQNCASLWGQCGGQGWSGPTCCESGSSCQAQNDWYSQCLPGGDPSPQPQPTTTTSTTTNNGGGPSVTAPPTTTVPGGASSTASYSDSPFEGVRMWANDYYSSEVHTLAIPQMTGTAVAKASAVAEVPSFQWMDRNVTVDTLFTDTLAQIRAANQAGANPPYAGIFVVYDLPDRDCAAAASNGEWAIADNGENNYRAYIDRIRHHLVQYSDVRTILVIEPDSLANMITNMDVPKCQGAADVYRELTQYAMRQFDLPHVGMYLDAGHAGWLGWPANLQPSADEFASLYQGAGSPRAVRGLATNVANFNPWSVDTPAPYTDPNPNYDEKHFVEAFAPLLQAGGFPARFIVDQGRSGKQPTGQQEWGAWCNAVSTGFGMRPTSNTGHNLVDAFVWIKPGGESDGTSDQNADRYDHMCGRPDAFQPAPEAGQWFQAYFEMLIENANPPF